MYIPIIKTTAAELSGFSHLADEVKSSVLPLFELTKDRSHKVHYPEGRLEEALKKALNAQQNDRLILDLTSHEDLINSQIEKLFDSTNGYKNWCSFIKDTKAQDRITPVVQIDGDQFSDNPVQAKKQIADQVKSLIDMCGEVVFRSNLDVEPNEVIELLSPVVESVNNHNEKLTIIIDAEYIRPNTAESYSNEILDRIKAIHSKLGVQKFVIVASSFPKSVTAPNYGDDSYGQFRIEEVFLNNLVKERLSKLNIIYGDYASIHPVRYDVRGGAWIPRVDVPLRDSIYYHRFRRKSGGYVKAAKEAVDDPKYLSVDSWGNEQIELAAKNNPQGLAPSFWISVRSNIHITTQAIRIKSIQK